MPHKCQKCTNFIKPVNDPGLFCAVCNKAFHRNCANLTQLELNSLESKEVKGVVWKCLGCRAKTKRRSSIFNSVQNNSSQLTTSASGSQSSPPSQPSLNAKFEDLLKQFQLFKTETEAEIYQLKLEITALKDSTSIPANSQESDNGPVSQSSSSADTSPIQVIPDQLNILEIRGLPAELTPSPFQAAVAVGRLIGCEIDSSEVTCISAHDKATIDLNFSCPNKRRDFLLAGKAFNRKNGRLVIAQRQLKFFVNEKLSDDKRKLLYSAKRLSAAHGYKFAWIVAGNIHIKRTEGEHSFIIHNEQQLSELFSSGILSKCESAENKNQPSTSGSKQ